MDRTTSAPAPDGIDARLGDPRRHRNVFRYRGLVLAALLLAALLGLLGGSWTEEQIVRSRSVEMQVHVPNPIRNGMFVEWRIDVKARRPASDLVVAIPARLWQDMTINSLVPAASQERFEKGDFLFHFGPLERGQEFHFKIDGQINPARVASRKGQIRLLDGDRLLAAAEVEMQVIP